MTSIARAYVLDTLRRHGWQRLLQLLLNGLEHVGGDRRQVKLISLFLLAVRAADTGAPLFAASLGV